MAKKVKFNWDHVQVVRLKDGSYEYGVVSKGGEFKVLQRHKKFKDAEKAYGLQAAKKWLSIRNFDKEYDAELYKVLSAREYWIVVPPIDPTDKEWDKYWWSTFNEKCMKCANSCKESVMVTLLSCNYKKAKG